jgi:hypothetical protein
VRDDDDDDDDDDDCTSSWFTSNLLREVVDSDSSARRLRRTKRLRLTKVGAMEADGGILTPVPEDGADEDQRCAKRRYRTNPPSLDSEDDLSTEDAVESCPGVVSELPYSW